MGSFCSYVEMNDALDAWHTTTRRKIERNNGYVDGLLAIVTSPDATQAVLRELEDLPSSVPGPKGTTEIMPMLLQPNCFFITIFLNDKYKKVHVDLTGLLADTRKTYEHAKTYLTALSRVEAALKETKEESRSSEMEPLSSADVLALRKDTDGSTSWTALQDSLVVLVGSRGFTNPMYLNITKVLLDLQLPDHPMLVKYVESTVTRLAQYRIVARHRHDCLGPGEGENHNRCPCRILPRPEKAHPTSHPCDLCASHHRRGRSVPRRPHSVDGGGKRNRDRECDRDRDRHRHRDRDRDRHRECDRDRDRHRHRDRDRDRDESDRDSCDVVPSTQTIAWLCGVARRMRLVFHFCFILIACWLCTCIYMYRYSDK